VELETRGIPTVTICTDEFFPLGKAEAQILGMPGLPIAHIPHPLASQPPDRVAEMAKEAFEEIVHILTTQADRLEDEYKSKIVTSKKKLRRKPIFGDEFSAPDGPRTLKAPESLEGTNMLFYRRGWTDGFPIIPPTEDRLEKMLAHSGFAPETLIGKVAPSFGEATVEKIAINAVMAGCLPEHLPVVIAAVRAMTEKVFNLYALQATTHLCTVMVLLNGPLAEKLDVNWGYNAMGQGYIANATIGRAVRLVLINIGGATPGVLDRATLGAPSKYSFCFAENEEENPWPPLHVEKGFPASQSTVTVLGAEGPHNVNDHGGNTAEEILTTVSGVLATPGANNFYLGGQPMVALGPEHASIIAGGGFSKNDVKQWLYENALVPMRLVSKGNLERFLKIKPERFNGLGPDDRVPILDRPEDLNVVVVGGNGRHSVVIPTFGTTQPVTVPITDKNGEPILVPEEDADTD
jgi:hypothetical protein